MANSRLGLRTRLGQIRAYTEGATGGDADATLFLTAAGITDVTITNAIQQLVIDLKTYGIWSKMKAIYPFCGGTASTHKWNLKDASDLDSAFRLVFSGGWTHSSTGATPNGTNAFSNTYFSPNLQGQNNIHLSVYNRTEFNGGVEMGSTTLSTGGNDCQIVSRISNTNFTMLNRNGVVGFVQTASTGFCLAVRNTSATVNYFRNNVKTEISLSSIAPNSLNIYLAARNANGTAEFYSPRECAFASIGDGLDDTEAANLYTAVQAFQTTLGRQV